jgi:lysine 6-dehydrogenase
VFKLRIVVLGAGRVGTAIAEDLVKYYQDIDEIIVGDVVLEKAKSLERFNPERVKGVRVDASKENEILEVIRDADAFINATFYGLAETAIKATLEAKVPYLDLGSGLYRYNDEFVKEGVPAILDIGGAPGLINILTKHAVNMMDEVEYIHLYDANEETRGPKINSPLRYKYSPETVLDEATMPAIVFRDGEFIRVPPVTGFEKKMFPLPIGEKTVFYIYHNEVETLARTFKDKGLKEVWYKIDAFNLPWEDGMKWKLLADIGFSRKEPIEVDSVKIRPLKVLMKLLHELPDAWEGWEGYELLQSEVKGVINGNPAIISISAIAEINWKTGSTLTAAPPAIVGYWLAKKVYSNAGALPPEQAVDSEKFLVELARRDDVKIVYEERKEIF